MRKPWIFIWIGLLSVLSGCSVSPSFAYETTDQRLTLRINQPLLKIMQITDLHLTYGIDHNDRQTHSLIRSLARHVQPDLIVITGDMTMSPQGTSLFKELIKTMESLQIPWTFVFGNHESDFQPNAQFVEQIKDTNYLLFSPGIEIHEGGIGNFIIDVDTVDGKFSHLYFLDSKAEDNGLFTYGYLSDEQVAWYTNQVQHDVHPSLAFMHIPLVQYQAYDATTAHDGHMNESGIYTQGKDTGFFAAMVAAQKTKGVFVGHDHLNDFSFYHSGILLAYGRFTGYNAYGNWERGARLIEMDASGTITTQIIVESELVDQ